MTNTVISGNSAAQGGGINAGDNAYTLYTDVRIFGNHASGEGGGIALTTGTGFAPELTSSFVGGTVYGNDAGGRGGGLYTQEPLDVSGTAIIHNQAIGEGGGIYDDGAEATVALTNSSPVANEPDNCGPAGAVTGC
jgi:hypothetical protein